MFLSYFLQKQLKSFFILLLAISIPMVGIAQTCQDNILTNPDFEAQHISGWNGAGMYSESGSDRYISVCTNGTNARQTKSAIGGEEYTLTVSARKSFADSRGVIRLKFLSSSWQPVLEKFAGITATSFQTLSINATAPADAAWVEVSLIKDGGSGCVDADNWCLSTSGGGGTNLPDLRLGNLTNLANAADPGAVVQFNFNLINSGAVAVSGNYSIGAYLSTDANLGSGDVRVGEVNTGNTAVGTISNIAGAITIPNNTATGTYSLILKADDGEVITESNENNNLLLGSIAIGDTGGGDGPTVTLSTPNSTVTGPFTVSVIFSENVTDFTLAEIQVTNGTKSNPAQQHFASYSFTVTPTSAGNVTIVVPTNVAFGADGTGNQVSNTLVVNYDTGGGGDGPTVTLTTANTTVTAPFTVNVSFSENVSGFTLAAIQVTNGTKSNAAQQNTANYSFTVTPTSAGNVTIVVPANSASNGNGEGNQVSNTLVVNFGSDPGGDECGFTTVYSPSGMNPISLANETILSETNAGFTIESIARTQEHQISRIETYQLTLDGDVTSASEESFTPAYDVKLEVDSDNNLEMVFLQSPDLPAGTRIAIDVNYTNPTAVLTSSRAFKTSTGFAFGIGIVDNNVSPNILNRVIQTDNLGQNVVITNLPEPAFFSGFSKLTEGPDGSLYTWWFTAGNFSLYAVPASGQAWHAQIVADTPSSTWVVTKVSPDGQFVYTAKTDNQQAFISKFNASNGTLLAIDLSELKISNEPSGFRQTFVNGIQPTADGGLLVNLFALEVGGSANNDAVVFAKYNAAGNLVWKKEIVDVEYNVSPIGETADGGALFAGNNPASQTTVFVKLTSTGSLTPDCNGGGGGGDGVDLELNAIVSNNNPAQWSFFSSTFVVTNNGDTEATGVEVQIPTPDGIVLNGGGMFSVSQGHYEPFATAVWTVGTIAAGGNATITLNYFNKTSSAVTIFGQVYAQDQTDVDSSPNNNNGPTPSEDDEAAVTINASSAAPRQGSIEELSINQVRDFQILNTYPTVSNNEITIAINSKKEAQLLMKIYNMKGQEVSQQQINITTGANEININISELNSGMHHVMILPKNGRPLTTRFIKQRL